MKKNYHKEVPLGWIPAWFKHLRSRVTRRSLAGAETLQLTDNVSEKYDPYRLVSTVLANQYQLIDYAGGGGMGAVYYAFHKSTKSHVAVKILKPDISVKNPVYLRLFEQEVRAAQQLSHPN